MTDNINSNLQSPFRVGEWNVDPDSGRLHKQGAEVKLEPKVMRVLQYLSQHQEC
jgi:DNA-binding winged helix-turn-helix (wHTH) protein